MGSTKAIMAYSQDQLSEGFMHEFNTNYSRTVLNTELEKVKTELVKRDKCPFALPESQ